MDLLIAGVVTLPAVLLAKKQPRLAVAYTAFVVTSAMAYALTLAWLWDTRDVL